MSASIFLHPQLLLAVKKNDLEAAKALLAQGADPTAQKSKAFALSLKASQEMAGLLAPFAHPSAVVHYALRFCAEKGWAGLVSQLIPSIDPKTFTSDALDAAATEGFLDCVNLLIPVSRTQAHDAMALRLAARWEHLDCVRALLPASSLNRCLGSPVVEAFFSACTHGSFTIARELADRCDLDVCAPKALRHAAFSGHPQLLDLLTPFCQPQAIFEAASSVMAYGHVVETQAPLARLARSLPHGLLEKLWLDAQVHHGAREALLPILNSRREAEILSQTSALPASKPSRAL
jgi:hypothetical protein